MTLCDVVVAGYICVDLVPDLSGHAPSPGVSSFFKPGKLIEIGGLAYTLGGVVANTGAAMKKFGKSVYCAGLTGEDFIGDMARGAMERLGLAEGIGVTADAGTAFGLVIAPPGIDRIFLESSGCSKVFDRAHIDMTRVAASRIFHFGYPPLLRNFYLDKGALLCELFASVKQLNVVTSLDFSLPDPESESGKVDWPIVLRRLLPSVDVFVPSVEELLWITAPEQYATIKAACGDADMIDAIPEDMIREMGRAIIDQGVKILLIKAGHRGLYLMTGDVSGVNTTRGFQLLPEDWSYRDCRCAASDADAARVINASGSGDVAAGAFLCALLDNEPPETALQYAAIAGRNNLYCKDMYSDLADWEVMTEEIKIYHE